MKLKNFNHVALYQLPPPGVRWRRKQVNNPLRKIAPTLEDSGYLKSYGRTGGLEGKQYSTTLRTWRLVAELSLPDVPGCVNTGVVNLGNGVYTCSIPECKCTFTKKIAEERTY